MDLVKLKIFLEAKNLPSYRIRQISSNYFSAHYDSFSGMTDLPKELRSELTDKFPLYSLIESKLQKSADTQKALLKLSDGLCLETVLMDYDGWLTACISSQVGCPLGCAFCATGKMGFKRNLTSEEIIDQILYWNHLLYPKYVGRIVFMGMGEPLLNWDNLLASLSILKNNLNIGARKISLSTAGIIPKILEFARLDTEINLAVSLHSLDQKVRQTLMPLTKQYPLIDLLKACEFYTKTTRRQLFLEYILIKDINDRDIDLQQLISLLDSHRLYFLNLIPLNPVNHNLIPSPRLTYFQKRLTAARINFSLRHSLGSDINSACGQLISQ